jgi:hypothetical protein
MLPRAGESSEWNPISGFFGYTYYNKRHPEFNMFNGSTSSSQILPDGKTFFKKLKDVEKRNEKAGDTNSPWCPDSITWNNTKYSIADYHKVFPYDTGVNALATSCPKMPRLPSPAPLPPRPEPTPAPKPTPVSKPKKPSFGAAFGRTETIGVTKQCGHREFDDLNLPKSEVSPGEFPWTCTLWTETNGKEVYLGSCAIIPNSKGNDITEPTRRVITAAHKLKSLTSVLKVRIEDANNSDDIEEEIFDYGDNKYDDPSGRAAGRSSQISLKKDYLVTDIAEHPDFDADRLLNDI